MSGYTVMIYGDEEVWESWTEDQGTANAAAHQAFNTEHRGSVVDGHQLDRSWQARSIRRGADGRSTVSDGPFVDGPIVLGGFYVIEATDLDHAVRIAADLPEASAPSSGVEVRPVAAGP
jgi:hypothetical protein